MESCSFKPHFLLKNVRSCLYMARIRPATLIHIHCQGLVQVDSNHFNPQGTEVPKMRISRAVVPVHELSTTTIGSTFRQYFQLGRHCQLYTLSLFGYFFPVVRPPLFRPWEASNYSSRSCNGPNRPKGPKFDQNNGTAS